MTKTTEHWQKQAEKLRELHNRPPLRVRDVQDVLGYHSTQAALHAIDKMIELGLVEFEQRGARKEYYLA
jgi:DNA-binding MarR family transcriptional regulator